MADIQPHHKDVLTAAISDLRTLSSQLTGIESIDAERAQAQAKLDHATKYLTQTKAEVKEAEHYRDKYLAEAREKLAESERLDKEIKEKRVVVGQLNDWINKIRAQLGA